MASVGSKKKVLIIVENLPSPFDRRVWQEASPLYNAGYDVSIICPVGKGYEKKFEIIDGIYIYRHSLPLEASGALGYLLEYSAAIFWEFFLAFKVLFTRGFDVIHACNPPDLIFLVGGFFKIFFRKKFIFDHHDINPELYEAKFNRKDFFYHLMVFFEKITFMVADRSIATNNSYKKIAINRGGMSDDKVHVVRSGPDLGRLKIMPPVLSLKNNKEFLVGYIGVIGQQEGIDYLLISIKHIVKVLCRNNIHFTIIGDGTELLKLKKYACELDISDYVTFTGRIPDQEMLKILNTTDVCVNPDVANEMNDKSTMNKIMEYMALKKPIVQFDLTEGRFSAQSASLYAEKNNTIDFAEKILQLIDDPDARIKMGECGYNRVVNQLEWEYEAPKLLEVYDKLW